MKIRAEGSVSLRIEDVNVPVISINNSKRIWLEGLMLSHVKPLTEYQCHGAVISVDQSSYVAIVSCHLNGCGAVGVNARETNNLKVKKCEINNNTFNAIYIDNCKEVQIFDNNIHDNKNTFQVENSGSIIIWGNKIGGDGGYWDENDWSI